jgi:hypothetical protein
MPRRATRSANCHRDVADSSVALPKGQNALGVQRKGKFTPQALLHLAFGQAEASGDRIRNSQRDAHGPIESLRGRVGFLQRVPPQEKRRTLGGKRPPVWSAEIQRSPPDQVAKTSYTLYDVGRPGKVADGRLRLIIRPRRGGSRWRYCRSGSPPVPCWGLPP